MFSFMEQVHEKIEIANMVKRPDYPALFLIIVDGNLSLSWSDKLSGMAITTAGGGDRAMVSLLKGELTDQAALLGVLNTLHDLNFHLLKVECLSVGNLY